MESSAKPSFWGGLQLLSALFFLSGATSLVFETIFTRLMTYTFGNTAQAVSTVLAVFLGGLSVGAFVVGRLADRWPPSLRVYGALELLVGAYCLLVPSLFNLLTRTYVDLYHSFGLGPVGLTALRFGLALPLILPAAFLMGGTLPAVARFVASQGSGFQTRLDHLYALNCLGAAAGVLLSTYLLLPYLGVRGTVWLSCGIDFAIFASTWAFTSRGLPAINAPTASGPPLSEPEGDGMAISRLGAWVLLAGSFLTGGVALAYEVTWTHVLAFLIGNSVYAFGLMLFVFLCGLGWGARMVGHHLRNPQGWPWALGLSQLALGTVVLLTLPLWPRVHTLFSYGLVGAYDFDLVGIALLVALRVAWLAWRTRRGKHPELAGRRMKEYFFLGLLFCACVVAARYSNARYESVWFFTGELLRLLIAFYLLIVPGLLLGLSFPLLLNLYSRGDRRAGRSVGRIYAANTLGTVLGSLATGFLVLPWLGSLSTLRAAAAASALLGLGFALWPVTRLDSGRKTMLAGLAVVCGLLFALTPRQWDETRMSTGSYAYFSSGLPPGARVVFFKEDVQGGLTSVAAAGEARTLLTNGKFQGNNTAEVPQQLAFAFIPALFVHQFNHALVIGLGTGGTLRGVCDLPFRRIDVAELSPHIVEAARLWFGDVSRGAMDDPRVRIRIADGRNDLLMSRERYDLITLEISSLWISGQADLYNKEFYELCRARLGENGILQQWVAIHHLRSRELLVILNTAAKVFPHLAFFMGPSQGLLIASSSPLECDYQQTQNLESLPEVAQDLRRIGSPSMWFLLGRLVLEDPSMRRLLSEMPQLAGLAPDFVSSDLFPDLEYQSPKGITLPYDSFSRNLELLLRFRPQEDLPPGITIQGLPSDNERELVLGYIAEARGDRKAAVAHFSHVSGVRQEEANAEIARLSNGKD